MSDWRPFFPLKEPRPDQARALDHMCAQAKAGKKKFLAELGTGVGKSAVAVTFGRWCNMYTKPAEGFNPGTTVLTSQRILQDQYVRDFKTALDLRSAMNFECKHPDLGPTCAATSRVRKAFQTVQGEGAQFDERLACSECPYRKAKEAFMVGPLGITNYSYFLSEAVYAEQLPLKHLLVLDEAHNVEDEVRRWASVSVTRDDAAEFKLKLPPGFRTDDAVEWLGGDYKIAIMERMAEIAAKLAKVIIRGRLGEKVVHKLAEENEMLDKRLCQINRILDKGGEIMVADQDGKSLTFSPLEVAGLANDILYNRADKVLLMTATVLDKKVFMRSAGLPPDTDFISIPTPFSAESFGVHLRPIGKMSRAGIDEALPLLPRAIEGILKAHPNDKGIIHTTNYNIARKVGEVKNRRLLVQTCAADRNDIIKKHFESKEPTVIVSPSMIEGLDLKGDLGRFQVMCKVPYPDMSDPVVKRKMNSDREWYAWRTVRSLAQAMGRGVRSEDDYTATYILDECYIDMLDRWGEMFPKHLTEAMSVEEPF